MVVRLNTGALGLHPLLATVPGMGHFDSFLPLTPSTLPELVTVLVT